MNREQREKMVAVKLKEFRLGDIVFVTWDGAKGFAQIVGFNADLIYLRNGKEIPYTDHTNCMALMPSSFRHVTMDDLENQGVAKLDVADQKKEFDDMKERLDEVEAGVDKARAGFDDIDAAMGI